MFIPVLPLQTLLDLHPDTLLLSHTHEASILVELTGDLVLELADLNVSWELKATKMSPAANLGTPI